MIEAMDQKARSERARQTQNNKSLFVLVLEGGKNQTQGLYVRTYTYVWLDGFQENEQDVSERKKEGSDNADALPLLRAHASLA